LSFRWGLVGVPMCVRGGENVKDSYYFFHDSNAKDDPKCSMLIEQLGLEGYGIYWVLVETLRDQPDYRYPLNMITILARKYNTTAEKIKVVIGNYGLFTIDSDQFFSEALCRRMEAWDKTRETKRVAGKKSGEIRGLMAGKLTDVERMLNGCSADVELREEKRRKENKDITVFQQTLLDFIGFRRKIKKPMTDHAIDLLMSELDKLAKTDDEKIAIMNQSILNGWQGVFAIKKQFTASPVDPEKGRIRC